MYQLFFISDILILAKTSSKRLKFVFLADMILLINRLISSMHRYFQFGFNFESKKVKTYKF